MFWASASGHCASDGEPKDKQGQQAIDEECLPLIPIAKIGPGEGKHEDGRDAVKVVRRCGGSDAKRDEEDASNNLDGDQQFADDQGSGETPRNRLAPQVGKESPQTQSRHEQHDGQREPIVQQEQDLQSETLPERRRLRGG